jgi:hypothetical protein
VASTARLAASCLILATAVVAGSPRAATAQPREGPPRGSSGLPFPHELPLADYERVLYKFLFRRAYADIRPYWARDKLIRDTGPFIGGQNYGTHPAVHIYYSPEVADWLKGGRRGEIADGGMIIKEMFAPPAALYYDPVVDATQATATPIGASPIDGLISAWTAMVKDRSIAKGGWFYAGPAAPLIDTTGKTPQQIDREIDAAVEKALDDYDYPFDYPSSGVALGTCQRCHASAEKELTFSAGRNILDFPGEPIRFRNDGSWRDPAYLPQVKEVIAGLLAAPAATARGAAGPRPASGRVLARFGRDGGPDLEQFLDAGLHGPQARRARRIAAAAAAPRLMAGMPRSSTPVDLNPTFVAHFPPLGGEPKRFPGQWADRVVAAPGGPEAYITSDNCLGCHGGLGGAPYGVTMFIPRDDPAHPGRKDPAYGHGYNVSEYGEWRWSPMGLAGRDPIFHAQVESELALLDAEFPPDKAAPAKVALLNLCLSCHGAMGQRQLALDAQAGQVSPITEKPLDPDFKLSYFNLTTALDADGLKQKDYEYHKYGNLAREGVSCTICHHIDPPDPAKVKESGLSDIEYFLMKNTTGRFERGPDDVLNGPFDRVAVVPMQNSLGVTPKFNAFMKDSRVCGTCHAINLPNVDAPYPGEFPYLNQAETVAEFKPFPHSIEQATFLEWQNSVFAADPGKPGTEFRSCQDCHMPGGFTSPDEAIRLPSIPMQIATIEDTNYPEADNGAPPMALHVPVRGNYRRHELVGLNVFLEMMFQQFEPILGVSRLDPMTGPFVTDVAYGNRTNGNALAIANMVRQARQATVDVAVAVRPDAPRPGAIAATVTVTNKAGHRFPSGVGFRRAFLEVLVRKKSTGEVVWGSGRTDAAGVIVDGRGKALPSEFLPDARTFQPHYRVVDAEDEAQIYEELTLDAKDRFTTSFIHRDRHPKDNRLLARGWLAQEHLATKSPIVKQFLEATDPEGDSVHPDPDFGDNDGRGATGVDHVDYVMDLPEGVRREDVIVRATMYYQAIPPFYLQQRFRLSPDGEATRRLYYLTSRLATKGTSIEDWKLPLTSATAEVPARPAAGSRDGK